MPDSLVAKWLVRPLAAASLTTTTADSTGGLPTTVGETTTMATTTTTTTTTTVKPTKIGINVAYPVYYGTSRVFMNLAYLGRWQVNTTSGDSQDSYFNANGDLIKYNTGDNIGLPLGRPSAVFRGQSVDIVCKWEGTAKVIIFANTAAKNIVNRANEARFTYVNSGKTAQLRLTAVDPADPLRNLDCRETSADPNQFFDPEYITYLKRYNTLRFMDWQKIVDNAQVTWATRSHTYGKNLIRGGDGMPIEWAIRLANETGTNPWFAMPWNADDDYVRRFAQLVHDTLDPKLTAYVETSNEVWNWAFAVTTQASNEGLAEGLSTDKGVAMLYRYAERTGQVMDIWSQVFAGQMNRIVRLASNQSAVPSNFSKIMAFRDTASKVDGLATAPYFGYNLDNNTVDPADLSPVFTALQAKIDAHLGTNATKIKQIAAQYGNKRFVTYEAGQHVTGSNTTLLYAIEHDQRMADLYSYYLRYWQQTSGDLMMLYYDIGPTSTSGAWGLLDNSGQSASGTPKGKAVTLFQASITK